MKNQKFVFILDAHTPYIGKGFEDTIQEHSFFDTISYTFLPLIKMCETLKEENVPFKFAVVFEASLCEMLSNKSFRKRYVDHLEKKIAFAKNELKRYSESELTQKLLKFSLELLSSDKQLFEKLEGNILQKFDSFAKDGIIEILGTTATACFLPFFKDMPEAISAQIEMGQIIFRKYFSTVPSGFFLPALAYDSGLDKIIHQYGYDYTLVESRAFLLSDKVPTSGVFLPALSEDGLIFLATDMCACRSVYDEKNSLSANPVYLDASNDVGFKLSKEELASIFDTKDGRREIGFRYWAKGDGEPLYDIEKAFVQIEKDAQTFVRSREEALNSVEETTNVNSPVSIFLCSSDFLGRNWCEGIEWLERVFRRISKSSTLEAVLPVEATTVSQQLYTVNPFFSSLFDSGYASELLTHENDWMYPHLLKATERMIHLAEVFANAPSAQERILNIAAREVFLAQSFYWQYYSLKRYLKDFAEKCFVDHIRAFNFAYEFLGADTINTKWISEREQKCNIFKDINYHFFAKKR